MVGVIGSVLARFSTRKKVGAIRWMNGTDDCLVKQGVTTRTREASTNTGSRSVRRRPGRPTPSDASRAITRPAPTGRRTCRRQRTTRQGSTTEKKERHLLNAGARADLIENTMARQRVSDR
jgi:hypothetical protein